MFNFLVTSEVGTWDSREYIFSSERFREYTSEDLKKRFQSLDARTVEELQSLPCLFAYEGNTHDMRVGYIRRISDRGSSIYFEFDFDHDIPPIPFAEFEKLKLSLDVKDRYELSRTHWAIKNEDLIAVLRRAGLLPADAAPSSAPGDTQRQPRLLTRAESIAAFEAIRVELDEIREAKNRKAETFIQSSQRVQTITNRGSLLIGSVPITVDLASIWRYHDRGILPEDGGAPIHAFYRRLFHYQRAVKQIVDILRDDVLWKLHGAPMPAGASTLGNEVPAGNAHDRQYTALLDLVQPVLRLVEWSKRYIMLLEDDGGVRSRIARSSHADHFRSAGAELRANWSRHEPAVFDPRVQEAFAAQRATSLTEKLGRLPAADRDEWDDTVRKIQEEADRLDKVVRASIGDYQRGAHLVSSGQRDIDPEHEFMAAAIEEARKSRTEPNKTPLFVGAVVVKDGKIIARGHRGQHKLGEHAEYTTLERNLPAPGAAANATLYCTLEPCIVRNQPKSPCAEWIKRHRIARVVIGVIDPNRRIRGWGVKQLRQAGIDVALFPHTFANEIEAMNSAFEREHELAAVTDESAPRVRGFNQPNTVPEIFYEWRRWENPTGKLENTEAVFDKAWIELDEAGGRSIWDVCVVSATEVETFFPRTAALKDQLAASRTKNKAERYNVVVAVVGDAPGDAECAAKALLGAIPSWPTKLGVAVLVGWIAKHHFVGEAIAHDL